MPRGRALGITMFLPERDQYSASKQKLESQISSLFGGRIAEELIFGKERVTTGAQNDIARATNLARNMVTRWGLSERLGPLAYSEEEGEVFLGRSVTKHKMVSEETAHLIDEEIRSVIDRNYERAGVYYREHGQVTSDGGSFDQVRDNRPLPNRRHHGREGSSSAAELE